MIYLWAGIWLTIGFGIFIDTPNQIKKDNEFIKEKIKPSVDFIKNFKNTNNRLPSYREYYSWVRDFHKDYTSDLTQTNDSLISDGFSSYKYIRNPNDFLTEDINTNEVDWNNDFAIGVWSGDMTEYYFSWTDSYDTNIYSRISSLISLMAMTTIGLFPLILWWLNTKKRTKSST